jgi:hypothetical protein
MSSAKTRKKNLSRIKEPSPSSSSSPLSEDKALLQSLDLLNESLNDIIKNSQDSAFKCHTIAKLGVNNLDQVEYKLSELLNKFKTNNNINHSNYNKKFNLDNFDCAFKSQKNDYDDSDSDEHFNLLLNSKHSDIMLNTNNTKNEYDEDDDLFQIASVVDCSSKTFFNDNLSSASPNKDFDLLEEDSAIYSRNDINNNNDNYYYDLLEKEEFEYCPNNLNSNYTSYSINNINNDFDLILQ